MLSIDVFRHSLLSAKGKLGDAFKQTGVKFEKEAFIHVLGRNVAKH